MGGVIANVRAVAFVEFRFWRRRCPHGVRLEPNRANCAQCAAERRRAEEAAIAPLIARRKQEDAADLLRTKEAQRIRLLTPTLEDLRGLHFRQFEDAIALSFSRQGYAVEQTPYSHDGGYDGILRKEGYCWLYECKRYGDKSASGRPDLQILHSAMTSQRAVGGMFITTGRFTKEALEFAKSANIRTIDGEQLVREIFDQNVGPLLDADYRTMCRRCGAEVKHSLRRPNTVSCPNGHAVEPSLKLGQVLSGKDLPTLDGRQITPEIVSAFKKAGYPPLIQGDIGTAKWWIDRGYDIKALERPIKCKGGHLRLYHRSQVVDRATAHP